MTEQSAPEPGQYERGLATLRVALLDARTQNLKPPPKLTLSEWADEHAVLSSETSSQTGRFRAYAYQRGMQDAFTDPAVEQITVMKSARVGYTKVLDHVIGYFLHQDPSPIMVVLPRIEDAEDYSKSEIEPLLRDVRVLAEIAGDPKAKNSNQTILKKQFSNGASLRFVGAATPAGFRRITVRLALFDEIDGYLAGGAGIEGDQIALGIKRTETFWNRKIATGSTPTIKGESRIEKRYLASDQRRYHVPCPQCGTKQPLEWGGPDTPHGIKWDKDEQGKGLPATAHYVCAANGCVIDESEKPEMIDRGEWIAAKPFKGHAGFHIWAGYSLHVNASWANIVEEWLRVKDDPLERQTFINLVLGEPYEDRGEKALNEARLASRGEVWDTDVPDGVALITAGLDTQDDRIEVEIVGWGRNEESWSIAYETFDGDPEMPETWDRVDQFLRRIWRGAGGRTFVVKAACIDSGGHHTQKVYDFAKARVGRNIWAIKGESAVGGKRSPVWPTKKPAKKYKASRQVTMIGVNAAKDSIRARLHIEKPAQGHQEPIAGYMHFPADRDINYFAQLTSERSVVKVSGGQKFRVWELPPGRANEALDCRVYAYAALCGLLHRGLKLNRLVDETASSLPDRAQREAPEPPVAVDISLSQPVPDLSPQLSTTQAPPKSGIDEGRTPAEARRERLRILMRRMAK